MFDIVCKIKLKARGFDGLDITQIQLFCPFIIPYITYIINSCISDAYFPKLWKRANVVPLLKIRICVLLACYLFCPKLWIPSLHFLCENDYLPRNQSGFRSGYSCATALSAVTDDIFKSMDEGKLSVLVLLDYAKAFEMLNHKLLLSILH